MWSYGPRRPRQAPTRDPALTPAAVQMLVDAEFSERPFVLSGGEMLASPPVAPPPTLQMRPVIPPWPEDERLAAAPAPPPPDTSNALHDGYEPPPMDLEPPVVLEPVPRFQVPEVDWQEELRERALREQQQQARQRRLEQLAKLIDEEGT